jgi:hypothetical protein
MIKWHDSRYWYFITQQNMGTTMSLNPRVPEGMHNDEPYMKRICVAPSAANCMTAIDLYDGNLYVYRTRRKVKARVPHDVYDQYITNEHWLMTRTRFTLVDTLVIDQCKYEWVRLRDQEIQAKDKLAIRSWCKRRDPRLAVAKYANQLWRNKCKTVNSVLAVACHA